MPLNTPCTWTGHLRKAFHLISYYWTNTKYKITMFTGRVIHHHTKSLQNRSDVCITIWREMRRRYRGNSDYWSLTVNDVASQSLFPPDWLMQMIVGRSCVGIQFAAADNQGRSSQQQSDWLLSFWFTELRNWRLRDLGGSPQLASDTPIHLVHTSLCSEATLSITSPNYMTRSNQ